MKKILCTIVLGLLLFSNIHARWTDNTSVAVKATQPVVDLKAIPKGTWKLVIHTNKTKEENYRLMGETLLEEDYIIHKVIRDFYIIRTFPQGYKRLGRDYILNLVGRDSVIVLTGFIIDPDEDDKISMDEYSRIENRGTNGAPHKECFHEMVRIATKMASGGEIEYVSE